MRYGLQEFALNQPHKYESWPLMTKIRTAITPDMYTLYTSKYLDSIAFPLIYHVLVLILIYAQTISDKDHKYLPTLRDTEKMGLFGSTWLKSDLVILLIYSWNSSCISSQEKLGYIKPEENSLPMFHWLSLMIVFM